MADAAPGSLTGAARPPAKVITGASLRHYARDRLQAAAAYPRDHLVRRAFRLARLDVTAWFASRSLAELCSRALVGRNADDPAATRLEIHVLDAEAPGWERPAMLSDDSGLSSRSFEETLAAENLRGFYHDAPFWQFYDPLRRIGVQTLAAPLAVPPWELASPLRLFMHWAHAAAGRRLTHAATLGLDGRGVLIAGASGSGKSGTTLAGVLNGLSSAGDDYVVLERDGSVTAHPVFATFKQDPAGLARSGVDRLLYAGSEPNWHGKIEFDLRRLAPGALAERLSIGAILIPRVVRAPKTMIRPAAPREAALALAPSAVLQLPGDSAAGFRFFADIVRRLPAFHLLLSEDPADIAAAVGSFIATELGHSH